jgi:hypothetical protein
VHTSHTLPRLHLCMASPCLWAEKERKKVVTLQCFLQDVQPMVNRFLLGFSTGLSRPIFSSSPPETTALSKILLSSLSTESLHWRTVILAHMWFNMLAPMPDQPGLMEQVLKLQLRHVTAAEMLLIKVCRKLWSVLWVGTVQSIWHPGRYKRMSLSRADEAVDEPGMSVCRTLLSVP